jgi:NADP-dependent 3-hydroxy acid dehydrogenase YdfG
MRTPTKRNDTEMGIDKMFDLSGKVAMVTGAAGSLGSAITTVYADAGADLLLVDIDGDGLHKRAKELERSGQRVHTVVASVGDIQRMTEAFEFLDREFGKIDILTNVADLPSSGSQKRLLWRTWNTQSTTSLQPSSSSASRRADGCWQRGRGAS